MELEEVYRQYHDKVLYYIRKKVNNEEDAEDLCSEVFMKVQKRLASYDSEKAAVSTWIYTIARNSVIDFYRTNKVTEELPEDIPLEGGIDEELLNSETLSELADALMTLSEEERTVLILHYYENLTFRAIEERTGLSYGQVKLRHNSGIKVLKKYFEKTLPNAEFRRIK